jgi:uncharacterized membrane protein (DUF4010 family)
MKQQTVGMRTFALASLLGSVVGLVSGPDFGSQGGALSLFPVLAFAMVIGYSFMIYYFLAKKKDSLGLTTMLSIPLAFIFGMMIGFGLIFEAITGAILLTLILYSRRYSHVFVKHLTEAEISDALQFAIVLFIIYPVLPSGEVTLYGLSFPLRKLVETIVVFSLISFAGFLATRLLGSRALPTMGFFAGFVSALSVVVTFSDFAKKSEAGARALASGIIAANIASIAGDIIILGYADRALLSQTLLPLAVMILTLAVAAALYRNQEGAPSFRIIQPFSVLNASKFAVAFFVVTAALQLISSLGAGAVYLVSFLGGMVSVTPVVVSLAFGAGTEITLQSASQGVIAAVLGGMLVKTGVLAFAAPARLRNLAAPFLAAASVLGLLCFLLF